MTRSRSPQYPSLSLPQAIDMAAKLHKANRTSVITRETAAKDMGYAGLTGRSLTVIAALAQFGLIEKAGKGDIKVTRRAVDILHPLSDPDLADAIQEAAFAPSLFQQLQERFPEGVPSQNALRSYLVQRDFGDVAIGPAINAFIETIAFAEKAKESERTSGADGIGDDGRPIASTQEPDMQPAPAPSPSPASIALRPASLTPVFPVAFDSGQKSQLNKINMNVQGAQVHLEALLDRKGIATLKKKLASLEALLGDDDDNDDEGRPDEEDLDPRD